MSGDFDNQQVAVDAKTHAVTPTIDHHQATAVNQASGFPDLLISLGIALVIGYFMIKLKK